MTAVEQSVATAPVVVQRVPKTRRGRSGAARVFVIVLMVLAVLWTLAPVYWMLSTSFKSAGEVAQLDPTLWPHSFTTSNYGELVGNSIPFTSFLVNSVLTSLIAAVVAVVISTFAAYSLSRAHYRLQGLAGQVILVTRMLPLVVLVGPLYLILVRTHLTDTYLGLIIGYITFGLPFGVWMMKGFIDAVPQEIEEAARVDGYGRLGILFRVVLPMTVPGLLTTAAFVFMDAWNNLLYPQTLINTENKQTLPPGLLGSFTGTFKTDWGGMMAAATITTIPLMVVFFAVQRYMVRGLTAGALTGE